MAKRNILTKYTDLHCTVITPKGQIADSEAVSVTIPAHDGNMQILPQHAPIISNLGCGILIYTNKFNESFRILVEGGVTHIRDNNVMVLARNAMLPGDITLQRSQRMLADAHLMPKVTSKEIAERQEAICRAKNLILLAQK